MDKENLKCSKYLYGFGIIHKHIILYFFAIYILYLPFIAAKVGIEYFSLCKRFGEYLLNISVHLSHQTNYCSKKFKIAIKITVF